MNGIWQQQPEQQQLQQQPAMAVSQAITLPVVHPPPPPQKKNTFHGFPEYMANKAIGMFINTQKFEDDFIFQISNSLPELPNP